MVLLPDTAQWSQQGHLCIGGCDTVDLVREYGTPLYVYDRTTLCHAADAYLSALRRHYPGSFAVAYAAKAYLCVELARLWASRGLDLDVVGIGELEAALRADFPPERIHLHGNNKPPAVLQRALEVGVGRIVIDGWHDLAVLEARSPADPVPVWLRLSPGVDAHTHDYRKTGRVDSKFGFPIVTGDAARAVERVLQSPYMELRGLHAHVGSQILAVEPFVLCVQVLAEFAVQMQSLHGWCPAELSPGGGWGVPYVEGQPDQSPAVYIEPLCDAVVSGFQHADLPLPHLVLEPGRSLVARAGVALYTIGGRRTVPNSPAFVALDGGLADNPRPALYSAQYTAFCANYRGDALERVTLCGPFCESGDILARDVGLASARAGDLVAVPVSGAYQLSMASCYNGFPRPAAVMVENGRAWLMQRRETVADLVARDVIR